MEKKLNGFNNGRDTTDGIGGKKLNEKMENKEEQLREAAIKEYRLRDFFDKEVNAFIKGAKSDFAKQYHSSNDSVDELRKVFENWYYDPENPNRSITNIFDWFLPHLQKQQESDAVEFGKFLNVNYTTYGTGYWKDKDGNTFVTFELYQLFKSNNNGNN